MRDRLAGNQAISSADPYLVIKIGSGENDLRKKKKKKEGDRADAKKATLNPQFFRTFELDASFPDDW